MPNRPLLAPRRAQRRRERKAHNDSMGCAGSKAEPESRYAAKAAARPASREFCGPHSEMASAVAAGRVPGEVLSCGEDRSVALTDWMDGKVLQRWQGHEKGVNCVLHAPLLDGAFSGSRDSTVRQWKVGQPAAVQVLKGHELTVSAIALDDTNAQLCSGSRDSAVRLWDVATGATVSRAGVSRNVVTCMAWVPGERLVWQGSEDLRLRLWDVRTWQQPAAVLEGYVYFPLACACDGHYCLTGSNGFDGVGCELRLWDRRSLKEAVHKMEGHEQAVTGVALLGGEAAGSRPRAVSGSRDGKLRLWELDHGGCVGRGSLGDGDGRGVTDVAAISSSSSTALDAGQRGGAQARRGASTPLLCTPPQHASLTLPTAPPLLWLHLSWLRLLQAQLLVSSTGGALHAMRADDAGLEVVATAAPRED